MKFYKYEYGNGNLAIECKGEIISVNLVDCYTPKGYAYIDTNNYPKATEWIKKNGIGEDTNIKGYSGFCSYPLFKINVEKLEVV